MKSFYQILQEVDDWAKSHVQHIALHDYGNRFKYEQRIHITNHDRVEMVPVTMGKDNKPWGGIWYGCGSSWIHYIYYNSPIVENYIYEIFINPQRVYFVKNEKDFKEFEQRYKVFSSIDWENVAKDYDGLEMCDYFKRDGWRHSWDVPSGVIWKSSALKGAKLLAQWDGNEYVSV